MFRFIRILSTAVILFLVFTFFQNYLATLQETDLESFKEKIKGEQFQKLFETRRTFHKSAILEGIINQYIKLIEVNPTDLVYVDKILIEMESLFTPLDPEKKSPFMLYYMGPDRELLPIGGKHIKDRKLVSDFIRYTLREGPHREEFFSESGRYQFFFGSEFRMDKIRDRTSQLHPIEYKGNGVHFLYFTRILDRKKAPDLDRTLLNTPKSLTLGSILMVMNWRNFNGESQVRPGIKAKNLEDPGNSFFYLNKKIGQPPGIYPEDPELATFLNPMELNKFQESSFLLGENLLTLLPINQVAKYWNYKVSSDYDLFQKNNVKDCDFLISKFDLRKGMGEIKTSYSKYFQGLILTILTLLIFVIYWEFSTFISLKIKLVLFLLALVGGPLTFYFFYKIREIDSLKISEFQKIKIEMGKKLALMEKVVDDDQEKIIQMCRNIRDTISFEELSEQEKVNLAERLSGLDVIGNIMVYNSKVDSIFTYDKGRTTTNRNDVWKSFGIQLIPYFVKADESLKTKILREVQGGLLSAVLGKNAIRLLEKVDNFSEINLTGEVTTFFVDGINDREGVFKYLLIILVKVNKYLQDLIVTRVYKTHRLGENFKTYLYIPDKLNFFPNKLKERFFGIFREKGDERFTGPLNDDADEEQIFALHFIEKYGYLLAMSHPKGPILNGIEIQKQNLIFNLILVFLMVFTTSSLLSYRILNPLKQLSEGMKAVEERNFEYKLHIHTRDEIQNLGNTFNNMLTGLAEKERLALQEKKIQTEMGIAKDIQTLLYPDKMPSIAGYQFFGSCRSADAVGGDYFDFVPVDQYTTAIIIGDVSGHGIPAALLMAMAKSASLFGLNSKTTPAILMSALNRIVYQTMKRKRMMTFFLGYLDVKRHFLHFVNAGHNYPLLRNDSGIHFMKSNQSYPLGIKNKMECQETSQSISVGDVMLFYTDGAVECQNPEGVIFGYDRLKGLLQEFHPLDPEEMVKKINTSLDQFADGVPYDDDVTLAVVKRMSEEKL